VEREQDVVGAQRVDHRPADRGEGLEEAGMLVEGVDDRQRRHVPGGAGDPEGLLDRRAGARRRVLREERQEHDPVDAGGAHPLEPGLDRRLAVAHRQLDLPAGAEPLAHPLGQVEAVGQERRAARGVPDLAVGVGALGRTRRQDDQVEEQPPPERADVEDPRIRQELAQVAPDRGGLRFVGGAQVDEQEAGHGVLIACGPVSSPALPPSTNRRPRHSPAG
jgi:hypothetical protein